VFNHLKISPTQHVINQGPLISGLLSLGRYPVDEIALTPPIDRKDPFHTKKIVTKSKICFTKLNLTLTWLRALLTRRFYSGLQRTISVKIFVERKSAFAFLKGERRFFQDACVWKLNSPKDPCFIYLHDAGFNKKIRFCQGGQKRVHHGGKFFSKGRHVTRKFCLPFLDCFICMARIHKAFSTDEINWRGFME